MTRIMKIREEILNNLRIWKVPVYTLFQYFVELTQKLSHVYEKNNMKSGCVVKPTKFNMYCKTCCNTLRWKFEKLL